MCLKRFISGYRGSRYEFHYMTRFAALLRISSGWFCIESLGWFHIKVKAGSISQLGLAS